MNLRRLIRFSFSGLWRRKLRTILTIWGMSVGIGAMVLLISFAAGLQQEAKKSFLSSMSLTEIQVMKQRIGGVIVTSGDASVFTEDDLTKLRTIPHVKAAYISIFLPGLQLTYRDVTTDIFAEPMPVERVSEQRQKNLEAGAWWSSNDDAAIVLSSATISKLEVSPADLVGQDVTLRVLNYTATGQQPRKKDYAAKISGVLNKDSGSFMGASFGQESIAFNLAKTMLDDQAAESGAPTNFESSNAIVLVDEPGNVATVRKAIEDLQWFPSTAEDMLKSLDQGFLVMKIVLGIIGGIALFVALIGIANSMLMAVLERTREIGILKSLGASRQTISWMFLNEAAWIGAFGAIAGIGGAYLIGQLIVAGIKTWTSFQGTDSTAIPPIQFSISWLLAVGSFVGAVLITLFAGWLPANRAARQDPVKALRHE